MPRLSGGGGLEPGRSLRQPVGGKGQPAADCGGDRAVCFRLGGLIRGISKQPATACGGGIKKQPPIAPERVVAYIPSSCSCFSASSCFLTSWLVMRKTHDTPSGKTKDRSWEMRRLRSRLWVGRSRGAKLRAMVKVATATELDAWLARNRKLILSFSS